MPKPIGLLLVAVFIAGCRQGNDGELRKAYLEEHITNCTYVIGYTLGKIERYKLLYRQDTAYSKKIVEPIGACHRFADFLRQEFGSPQLQNQKPTPVVWEKALKEQQNAYNKLVQLIPGLLRREIALPVMEGIQAYDSDELKTAKYYSNCQRLCQSLYNILRLAENPSQRILKGETRFMGLFTASDTISLGDTLRTMATAAYMDNLIEYAGLHFTNDIKPVSINLQTGRFLLRITGPDPKAVITYMDFRLSKKIYHEMAF